MVFTLVPPFVGSLVGLGRGKGGTTSIRDAVDTEKDPPGRWVGDLRIGDLKAQDSGVDGISSSNSFLSLSR